MGIRKKLPEGTMLSGYPLQIGRRIGAGGMAVVYEALDTELGLTRAVKILDVGVTGIGGKDPVEELRREARVMAKLHQRCKEHIVQVLFVGRTKDESGSLFIVMERLVGCSLKDLIQKKGALPWVTAKQVVQNIGEALAATHEMDIVHRDVKPANIFVDAPPERRGARFVLLDFGIAAILDSSTNRFKGTFKYAAPEQTRSPAVLTARTDMYSLGVVLYEMLTGRHPFAECANDGELVRAHRDKVPRPVSAFARGAPPELDALVASMMAKSPSDRPSSMRAMVDALYAIRWDDRRELKPPSDIDTTVEEIGTAVQNVEEEHQARAVPMQLAPTDPILPYEGFNAPNATPGTLESRVDEREPQVFRQVASVVIVDPPNPPATPKMRSQEMMTASAPIGPRPNGGRRLPDITEPMFDAPARPAHAPRAPRRNDTEPVDLPMHWSSGSMRVLVAAILLGAALLSVGFIVRGSRFHTPPIPLPSSAPSIALPTSSATATRVAPAPSASATVVPNPVIADSTPTNAPLIASTQVTTPPPTRPTHRSTMPTSTSTSTAAPSASHDPDQDLFKHQMTLPGSGL